MSFWPLNILNGYVRADRTSRSSTENSTMFYFDAKNPNRKKKKKRPSPASASTENNNVQSYPVTGLSKDSHEATIVQKHDRFEYYRVSLFKNESLHTIAMKYGCSIWELKRANRLWGLQDVHALTSLVVPAPRNSYRAELLAKSGGRLVARRGAPDDDDSRDFADAADPDLPDDAGDLGVATASDAAAASGRNKDDRRPVSLRQAMSTESLTGDCDRFLRTLDADLEEIKRSTCFLKDSLPEVADYLNTPAVLPPQRHLRGGMWGGGPPSWLRRLKGAGVDGGLSWRGALCLVCVLCLLLPALVYIFVVRQRTPH